MAIYTHMDTRSHGHTDTRLHGYTDTWTRRLAGKAGGRTPVSSSPGERRAEAEPSSPMTPSLITRKRPKFGASSSRLTSTSTAAAVAVRYGRTRKSAHAAAHTADPSLHGSLTISAFFGQGRGGGGGGRPSAGGGGKGSGGALGACDSYRDSLGCPYKEAVFSLIPRRRLVREDGEREPGR